MAVRPNVAEFLVCPVCGGDLWMEGEALRCERQHTFDVARQGYVSLLSGSGAPGSADTAAMVEARDAFLRAGRFDPIAEAVASEAAAITSEQSAQQPLVVDAGAGTGHYLAAVLDRLPQAVGLALDASKHAARRAARAHPRAAAAVSDVWQPLPVRSGAATLVLDVFSPRNPREFRRMLDSSGALLVVTPQAEYLGELVRTLDLLVIDRHKEERLAEALAPHFLLERRLEAEIPLELAREDAEAAARMGPSAHHLDDDELDMRIASLREPVRVTAAYALSVYRPR